MFYRLLTRKLISVCRLIQVIIEIFGHKQIFVDDACSLNHAVLT